MTHFIQFIGLTSFVLLIIAGAAVISNRKKRIIKKKELEGRLSPLLHAITNEYLSLTTTPAMYIILENKLLNKVMTDLTLENHIFFTSLSLSKDYFPVIIGISLFNRIIIFPKNLRNYTIEFLDNNIREYI